MSEKNKEEVDPRAKKECVLCGKDIPLELYLHNGNYCYTCIMECNRLERLNPGEYLGSDPEKIEKNVKDREYYDKESKRFQLFLR